MDKIIRFDPKLYVDTSIPNAYYDDRVPVRQLITQRWFENEISDYKIYISNLVLEEINRTKIVDLKEKLTDLILNPDPQILELNNECYDLANLYIRNNAIPEKEINDALHVSTAVVNQIPLLSSWNFKHLVKANTISIINKINIQNSYKIIEIGSLEIYGGAKYGNLS
jgi:predicted nucleic acid-binding protein